MTDQEIILVIQSSTTLTECIEKLKLRNHTNSYIKLNKIIERLKLDTSHFSYRKNKQNKHTKELLEPIVLSSNSYAECLRKLGLKVAGGNYKLLQRNIDKFKIDCSHMLHQAINQGVEFKTFDDLISNDAIKSRLVKERGHKCEVCNLTEWLNKPICLELEHIDGNNRNNKRLNLKLICPNCHSQTPTWRNRKRK